MSAAIGMVRPCSCPRQQAKLARGAKDKEHAMSQTPKIVIGIDIGKISFHIVAPMDTAPSCCGKSGCVVRWKRGSPICRLA